jgi:hypothetical protein
LWVKRFFCPNDACFRRTFVERFEEVLPFYSRRTKRLTDCLEVVGMEMGGEAGARVICRFAIPVSADTILRLLRRIELAEPGILRAIGVDDWAFKKGRD